MVERSGTEDVDVIRVAGATYSFGDLDLDQSAGVLKQIGFELANVGAATNRVAQIKAQEAADDPDAQAARLRRVMDRNGLEPCSLNVRHFGTAINHPGPRVRERSRSMFDRVTTFARIAKFESVIMLPGHVHHELGQTYEQAFDTSVAELPGLLTVAGEKGLRCLFEPCVGSIAERPPDALRLVEAVAGLGLTVDCAHQLQIGFTQDEIETLYPHAGQIHARQSAPGTLQVPADEGTIDFHRMIRKLKADGYDGVVCVAYETNQDVLDAGWDVRRQTARLKQILEDALVED